MWRRLFSQVSQGYRRREAVQSVRERSQGLTREQLIVELERQFQTDGIEAPFPEYFERVAELILGGIGKSLTELMHNLAELRRVMADDGMPSDLKAPRGVLVSEVNESVLVEDCENHQKAIASVYDKLRRGEEEEADILAFGWLKGTDPASAIDVMIGPHKVGRLPAEASEALAEIIVRCRRRHRNVLVELFISKDSERGGEYVVDVNIP